MPRRRLTFKPMLVVFTGFMAVIALVLNGITWTRVKESIEAVVVAEANRDAWETLFDTLKDAETGQRGFVITGDRDYLKPFESASHRIGENLSQLKQNADSDEDAAEIAVIEEKVLRRFAVLWDIAGMRERDGYNAARDAIAQGNGKDIMDDLRNAVGFQIAKNRALVATKAERMSTDLRWGYFSALGAGLVAMGSGLVAFLLLKDALKHARREQHLTEENRRVESADREKSAFLATMSHEIRTPLNAILGFAELLHERLSEERERKYAESILAGGKSLLQLINDILDLSKIEAGMMEVRPEPTDLRATGDFLRQLFDHLAAQRGVELRIEVDENLPPSLLLDNLRFRQILINLVGNAVKFTSRGHIALRVSGTQESGDRSRHRLVVEVEDTGRGIPADRLDAIFRPFVQESEDSRRVPGTGLGLAIVERLTRLMHGEITVRSEVGKGTCFRIEFPGVEVSSRIAESLLAVEDVEIDFDTFRASKILVADDNATNRELIAGIFEGTTHHLTLVSDGKEVVNAANLDPPDLVLMDVRMPKMDGVEALTKMRTLDRLRHVPVIAVTASSLGSEDAMVRRKFDGYLRKPFSRVQLYRQIAQFIPVEDLPAEEAPRGVHPDTPDTPELRRRWARLVSSLEETLREDHPSLLQTMSVPEIERFARRLRAFGELAACAPLLRFAAGLESDAGSFSPDLMESTLREFPRVVEAIRAAV